MGGQKGEGIIIVDGGGGTVDISAYRKPKFSDKFEEIVASECTGSNLGLHPKMRANARTNRSLLGVGVRDNAC